MRLLGVDFGQERLGLALASDGLVEPLKTLRVKSQKAVIEKIVKICQKEKVEKAILGLPLNLDGTESLMAKRVKKFGKRLTKALGVPVEFWDESLTTREAKKLLAITGRSLKKRRLREDQVAAAIMLQSYLDSLRG